MNSNKINKWLNNPTIFRYGFYIILLISTILFGLNFEKGQLYVFFILATIFLGSGFYKMSSLLLVFLTTILVLYRFFLTEEPLTVDAFLTLDFSYILIMFISAGLMKRSQKIKEDNFELILALSKTLDSRDTYTSNHSQNVAQYAYEIAKAMKLPKSICQEIFHGGLLHDIGKIGIPENILLKAGELTDKEKNIIKRHPCIGYEIIKHISDFDKNSVLDIVLYHHERYNGEGYPEGLMGNQIPLAARIIAIADTFDAMTTKRVYRNKIDLETTLIEIKKNKGTQFDPEIADVFLKLFENKNSKFPFDHQMEINHAHNGIDDVNYGVR